MKILLPLLLACLLSGCRQDSPTHTVTIEAEPTKQAFIQQASIFASTRKLRLALHRAKLTYRDVVEICRMYDDIALRAKLIGAMFGDNEFENQSTDSIYWAAYRYNLLKFVEHVSITKRGQRVFMDIGSGNGEKLFGALCLGFQKALGVEYDARSVQASRQYLKDFPEVEIRHVDALKVESDFLQKADFYYMYSPIKNDALMAQLFKRIMLQMKEGDVLLEVRFVYAEALRRLLPYDFPTVRGWLAVKREKGAFFYKNVAENHYGYDLIDGRDWLELKIK